MRDTATRWTLIGAARSGDADAQQRFYERYHGPVLAYLRRRGAGSDAEDLTQEVFLRLFAGGVLNRATQSGGRFRSLLFAVTRHVLADSARKGAARKRGGGLDLRSLGDLEVAAPEPEEASFAQEWLAHLVERSLERLAREHPNYHEALRRTLLAGERRADIAAALERSEASIRNWVHRGRRKLLSYLREEAWHYTADAKEYAEELAALSRLLGAHAKSPAEALGGPETGGP